MLHQRMLKKCNSLKYKPTSTVKVKRIADETGNPGNRTYAEVTRAGRNPTTKLGKTSNADNNHKQNIHEKLLLISAANRFRRKGNNLIKNPSNTHTTNNYTQ